MNVFQLPELIVTLQLKTGMLRRRVEQSMSIHQTYSSDARLSLFVRCKGHALVQITFIYSYR